MLAQPSRDSLESDPTTVILTRRRFSCGVECTGPARLLDRAGVTTRQWDHRRRHYWVPIRDMFAVIAAAERERRTVLIEDDVVSAVSA